MKKILIGLMAMFCVLSLTSCGEKEKEISSKKIVKLFNDKNEQKFYVSIDTGYYELNDMNQRLMLEKLSKAGVIQYVVERYAWYTECKRIVSPSPQKIFDYYYIGENNIIKSETKYKPVDTVTNYDYEEHFMVKVALTDKIKKYIKKEKEEKVEVDEDMRNPEYNVKDWPYDTLHSAENWPVIVKPSVPKLPHERIEIPKPQEKKVEQPVVEKKPEVVKEKKPTYPICKCLDKTTKEMYENAKKLENQGQVELFAYEIKAVKARKIKTYKAKTGVNFIKAEIITNTVDVTPQGHLLNGEELINGIPNMTIVYLCDFPKGWKIIDSTLVNEFEILPKFDLTDEEKDLIELKEKMEVKQDASQSIEQIKELFKLK